MNTYTAHDILRIAKRFNNKKRTYLLVNPLQAKHIPVSPKKSMCMMKTFGNMLAAKYPDTKLIIGFAETATAIAAAVAECFAPDCIYIHTTRETVDGVSEWIHFLEEHSHAAEQSLVADQLSAWIAATDSIILIDDEISTGKTLINIIEQLRQRYPDLKNKNIVAASLLNRVSEENEKKLAAAGIASEYLIKLPEEDYTTAVADITISEASPATPAKIEASSRKLNCSAFDDPRKGVTIDHYKLSCESASEAFLSEFACAIKESSSVLVLGTEECMYPALKLGIALENLNYRVRCHATTRSPIGICANDAYPITSGHKLRSFYSESRPTYIYNLSQYDALIVVSDTSIDSFDAIEDLIGAIPNNECLQIFYIQGGQNLWCVKR